MKQGYRGFLSAWESEIRGLSALLKKKVLLLEENRKWPLSNMTCIPFSRLSLT